MPALFNAGFSVNKPMWHGLGTVADRYPADWTEAREWAGLQWEPMALATLKATLPSGVEIDLPDYRLIVRDDTFAPLGVTSDEYEAVTNTRMGDIVEAVLSVGFKFETAGVLRGGKSVWALAYLDEPFVVKGDESHSMGPVQTLPYLAVLNDHSGSGACKALYTDVRVVCWNTYRAAEMRAGAANTFVFRHTAGVNDRIAEAKGALAGIRQEASEWQQMAADLFDTKLVNEDEALNHFLAEWEPTSFRKLTKSEREAGLTELPERSREHTERARKVFRHLYLDGITNETHRGTALGLVDTAVEFVDHVQGREAGRFSRFLTGDPRKTQAVKLARKVANG